MLSYLNKHSEIHNNKIAHVVNLCKAHTNTHELMRACTKLGKKIVIKCRLILCESTGDYADLHEVIQTATSLCEPLRACTNLKKGKGRITYLYEVMVKSTNSYEYLQALRNITILCEHLQTWKKKFN